MKSENVKNDLSKIKKTIFLIAGIIFLVTGILGIFLPLLPTTIFLIFSSYCFMKSSPALNSWLTKHKHLGVYIKNYRYRTGVPMSSKVSSILMLWISITTSALLFTENIYIRLLLPAIAVGITLKNFIWK
ncbi:MAG: YbaN family protein [Ignavibacteria bacterium]|jgi:hypothetical protein